MQFRNNVLFLGPTTTASTYRWLGLSIMAFATLVFTIKVTKEEINWRMEKGSSVS